MRTNKPICDWCRQTPGAELCSYHQIMLSKEEPTPGGLEFIKAIRVALKGPTVDKTVIDVVYSLEFLVRKLKDTSLSHQEARRLSIKTCEELISQLKGT